MSNIASTSGRKFDAIETCKQIHWVLNFSWRDTKPNWQFWGWKTTFNRTKLSPTEKGKKCFGVQRTRDFSYNWFFPLLRRLPRAQLLSDVEHFLSGLFHDKIDSATFCCATVAWRNVNRKLPIMLESNSESRLIDSTTHFVGIQSWRKTVRRKPDLAHAPSRNVPILISFPAKYL